MQRMSSYVTVKIYGDTRRLLRLIAAQTGEQMVQVMQRLCEDEWTKISQNLDIAHKIAQLEDRSSGTEERGSD